MPSQKRVPGKGTAKIIESRTSPKRLSTSVAADRSQKSVSPLDNPSQGQPLPPNTAMNHELYDSERPEFLALSKPLEEEDLEDHSNEEG